MDRSFRSMADGGKRLGFGKTYERFIGSAAYGQHNNNSFYGIRLAATDGASDDWPCAFFGTYEDFAVLRRVPSSDCADYNANPAPPTSSLRAMVGR